MMMVVVLNWMCGLFCRVVKFVVCFCCWKRCLSLVRWIDVRCGLEWGSVFVLFLLFCSYLWCVGSVMLLLCLDFFVV